MTFKLIIEQVTGGYILTTENSDGVERSVIGIDYHDLDHLGVLNLIGKGVGYTIMKKLGFKTTDKEVILNVGQGGETIDPQEWSEDDIKMYNRILARLYCDNPTQPETMNSKWFKEHCNKKPLWKPSKEQMDELYKMVCECRPADQQLLNDLYFGLQTLL